MNAQQEGQPEYPVAGHGRVRRLGQFPRPDVSRESQDGLEPAQAPEVTPDTLPARRRRAIVSVYTLLVGTCLLAVGIWLWFGLPQGITTLGVLTLGVGLLIARDS